MRLEYIKQKRQDSALTLVSSTFKFRLIASNNVLRFFFSNYSLGDKILTWGMTPKREKNDDDDDDDDDDNDDNDDDDDGDDNDDDDHGDDDGDDDDDDDDGDDDDEDYSDYDYYAFDYDYDEYMPEDLEKISKREKTSSITSFFFAFFSKP